MKKLAVLLVCMLLSLKCLVANPVPIEGEAHISEIMFDAEKGWILELNCYNGEKCPFLSITVSSSSGSAKSNYLPLWDGYYSNFERVVLTRDSMDSNLNINPLGDKITVVVEYEDYYYEGKISYNESSLAFGYYQGARVQAPFEGQSIGSAYTGLSDVYGYAKTNYPTIGAGNDVSKMYGTVTGKIYDKNNQLLLSNDSMTFFYTTLPFEDWPNSWPNVPIVDGTYFIQTLANRFSRNYVYISNKKVKIKPFEIEVEPDETIEQNIYLLEDFTDIKEVNIKDNSPVRIYPNPLSGGQELQYEVGAPVKSLDCRMEIVSMEGHLVFEGKITDNVGAVTLPHSLPSGTYIVNFKFNNKTQYATRLIIGK